MATKDTQETEVKAAEEKAPETKPKRTTAATKAAKAAEEAKAAAAEAEQAPAEDSKPEGTADGLEVPVETEVKAAEAPAPSTEDEVQSPEPPAEEHKVVKPRNLNDPVTLRVKNNGPRTFEVFTKTDLPAGETTEILCRNLRQANAVKSKFEQLNRLAKKSRYEVEEV